MPGDESEYLPPVHALLDPIAFLLGTWRGTGAGLWGAGFQFEDVVGFSHDGRPVLSYAQRTTAIGGAPSHVECGYFAARPGGEIHVTLAEPSGITEVLTGRVIDGVLDLASTHIGRSPSAINVTGVARRLWVQDNCLVTEVDLSVNGEPLAPHTRSVLSRANP